MSFFFLLKYRIRQWGGVDSLHLSLPATQTLTPTTPKPLYKHIVIMKVDILHFFMDQMKRRQSP